jgi:hypothetical protein
MLARLVRKLRVLEQLCKPPQLDIGTVEQRTLWVKDTIKRLASKQLACLIRAYVDDRRKSVTERCHSCECKISAISMHKHMKACRESFEMKKVIQKIDAQISGKYDDLKFLSTESRKIEMDRKKDNTRPKGWGYIQHISKSNGEQPSHRKGYDCTATSDSDSDSSSIKMWKNDEPPKCLKECSTVDLIAYQNIA